MMECRRNGKRLRKKIDVKMEEFPFILQSINEFLCEPYTAVIKGTVFEKFGMPMNVVELKKLNDFNPAKQRLYILNS